MEKEPKKTEERSPMEAMEQIVDEEGIDYVERMIDLYKRIQANPKMHEFITENPELLSGMADEANRALSENVSLDRLVKEHKIGSGTPLGTKGMSKKAKTPYEVETLGKGDEQGVEEYFPPDREKESKTEAEQAGELKPEKYLFHFNKAKEELGKISEVLSKLMAEATREGKEELIADIGPVQGKINEILNPLSRLEGELHKGDASDEEIVQAIMNWRSEEEELNFQSAVSDIITQLQSISEIRENKRIRNVLQGEGDTNKRKKGLGLEDRIVELTILGRVQKERDRKTQRIQRENLEKAS